MEEPGDDNGDAGEQEEALVALIEHRTKEVEHIKQRLAYYSSQLEEAERKLIDSQSQLARFRSRTKAVQGSNEVGHVKVESSPAPAPAPAPVRTNQASRPQLLIPPLAHPKIPVQSSADSKIGRAAPVKVEVISRTPASAGVRPSSSAQLDNGAERTKPPEKRPKRKIVQKEHRDLIPSIRTSSSPHLISFQSGTHISSQHKRKLRSLALSPASDQLFVTSALDGVVNLWQVQAKGPSASLLSTTDCLSPKQRRWPEDITWHPDGDILFAAYSADGGDSQISILNLNLSGDNRVTFLEGKPHLKGIINSIFFMPWVDLYFATGGSDHAVVLWTEKDGSWKPKTVHRNHHSSAVMGVAGLQQKKIILSVGADKRIIGFDVMAGRPEYKHQTDSKCMSVLPNPSDFNLFMVQEGTPEKQLRLFDIRLRGTVMHAFGWKQESSESQSALINQSWSPDGLYISSGSADPKIHIFDIRYNAGRPSQSVQAHQKRVFKADWHQSLPLLISISSDLNVGLHKIT